ncbi:MAG: hypothetical protein M1821_005462 [Bathelium mastoideum]|nr:MAG: hypothetical protein M1821_005462 [Bathelium mastoideum]
MDDYPETYVAHNYPLVVLSGLGSGPSELGQENAHRLPHGDGATFQSDLPQVAGERADELLSNLFAVSDSKKPRAGKSEQNGAGLGGFQLEAIGRRYTLPPRKAAPPPSSPTMSPQNSQSTNFPSSRALHSPLSPLSPGSPVYPDGIMTPLWLEKHQFNVPAVFVSFITFSSDPNRNSLNDNHLKNEINNVKGVLTRSGHRTRYAVVLISEKSIVESPDIEERLSTIRRATGLDPKTSLFFLPPNTSRVELSTFATSLLSALQPVCIEYYRDLTKHARRKKNRGAVLPPTAPPTKGTSQALSALGWSIRYDFKGGIFAEFRQEMEAAGRNYNMALDTLLGSDGIFETTHSWSGRWEEARLLADALALRVIRCFLWNAQTTSAVQFWTRYRDAIKSLLDRRGKGTATYGWQVWMARWAKVMAELIQKVNVQGLRLPNVRSGVDANAIQQQVILYAPAEKIFPVGERLPPWNLLAHPGYWFWLSARHAASRRKMAQEIPEEDRTPPGQSPAARVASRSQTYDCYLCPEPHVECTVDHGARIRELLGLSSSEFAGRGQRRFAWRLDFDCAKELMKASKHFDACRILRPVWQGMTWRVEGWWRPAFEVIWNLYECARACNDVLLIVSTSWELLSSVSVSFNFASEEGHVGEHTPIQYVLSSFAHRDSTPVTLSHVTLQFEGSLEQIRINHDKNLSSSSEEPDGITVIQDITLKSELQRNSTIILSGTADLTLCSGRTIILECPMIFREAGSVRAVRANLSLDAPAFKLDYSTPIISDESSSHWYFKSGQNVYKRHIPLEDSSAITILPKPPKLVIAMPSILSQYYVGEHISLEAVLSNGEEEEANVNAQVRIIDALGQNLAYDLTLVPAESEITVQIGEETAERGKDIQIKGMGPSEARTFAISFTAPADPTSLSLELDCTYRLIGDPETQISKSFSTSFDITNPLEASYQVSTYVHPEPWPDFFSTKKVFERDHSNLNSETYELDFGIARSWLISAQITSFASDDLVLEYVELACHRTHGPAVFTLAARQNQLLSRLSPSQQHVHQFELVVRTADPEERRPITLDLALDVTWRRADANATFDHTASKDHGVDVENEKTPITTSLLLSPFVVTSPEPRVVCTASFLDDTPQDLSVLLLEYTIENPTMHFLTFSTLMEASDEFAFSGSKSSSFNLVPLSRHVVRYHVMPLANSRDDSDQVIVRPEMKVTDVYFGQTLKVVPGDGVLADKDGILVDLSVVRSRHISS